VACRQGTPARPLLNCLAMGGHGSRRGSQRATARVVRVLGTGILALALVTAAIGPCLCPPIDVPSASHRCCEPGGPTLRAAAGDCCDESVATPAVATLAAPPEAAVIGPAAVVHVSAAPSRTVLPVPAPLLIALRI
jgi:hypothetical protein